MEQNTKNDFSHYTREQLYQIIENKDQEIEYWFSQLMRYLNTFSILLFIFSLLILIATFI